MSDSIFIDITLTFVPPDAEADAFPCKTTETYRFKIRTGVSAPPWDVQMCLQVDRLGISEDEQAAILADFLQRPEIREAEARGLLAYRMDGTHAPS